MIKDQNPKIQQLLIADIIPEWDKRLRGVTDSGVESLVNSITDLGIMKDAIHVRRNRHTGLRIEGAAHLAQSILDILTTPIGSLVTLRDYGSDLPDIIDHPLNGETMIDAYMATAEALDLWEPRIDLARIELVDTRAGYAEFELYDAEGNVIPMPIDLNAEGAR